MIDKNRLPYRQGAIAYILNKNNELLLVQHAAYRENEWRQPGGGIEPGENAVEAALREVEEELHIIKEQLELVGVSKIINEYDFPDDVLEANFAKGRFFIGQQQQQILFRVVDDLTIFLDLHEIRQYVFAPLDKLGTYLLFPNQFKKTSLVIEEFKNMGWI